MITYLFHPNKTEKTVIDKDEATLWETLTGVKIFLSSLLTVPVCPGGAAAFRCSDTTPSFRFQLPRAAI